MKKAYQKQKIVATWLIIKPWLTGLAIILILRYTGAFSGISNFALSGLLKSGVMDASPAAPEVQKNFNYDFSVKDMAGNTVDIATFKNKTIFLNLWATWCGPCRAEMPSIQSLYNQVDHSKIIFLMLSLDKPEHDNKITKYLDDNAYNLPVYRPVAALPGQIQVNSIPTTFIISPKGKIVSKKTGPANYDSEEFKKFLEGL